jgi:hypothetical protein|tara:strand:- start:1158 stop:1361 length:204 start_codon:yes stop_codon:yes gene_type:complete
MREYPKRPNPKTGKNFKRGDWNIAKNKRFLFYEVNKIGRDKKHALEKWAIPRIYYKYLKNTEKRQSV